MLAARLLGIGKTTLYRKLKEYESQNWTVGSSAGVGTGD
jgi:DNA-binding NtrC family response regulator